VVDKSEYYSQPSSFSPRLGYLEIRLSSSLKFHNRELKKPSECDERNPSVFRKTVWIHRYGRLWVLLGAVSWYYQCKQIQTLHEETMVPSYEQLNFSFRGSDFLSAWTGNTDGS